MFAKTGSRDGVVLYAWSSGGGGGTAHARDSAGELGMRDFFKAFLPKPNVIIERTRAPAEVGVVFVHVHPGIEASSKTLREATRMRTCMETLAADVVMTSGGSEFISRSDFRRRRPQSGTVPLPERPPRNLGGDDPTRRASDANAKERGSRDYVTVRRL